MELERRGYTVWRVGGYSQIDFGRSQMATDALAAGYEETMWIDSDIGFDPDAVDRLRNHQLPIVCGIYPKKGKRELAVHALPGTEAFKFGLEGGLVEVRYAATGFLLVQTNVYRSIESACKLPICNENFGKPLIPFFLPMILPRGDGNHWYLEEDYAFCERACVAGFRIFADTTIRLQHYGRHGYSWEDAGTEVTRYADYTYRLT